MELSVWRSNWASQAQSPREMESQLQLLSYHSGLEQVLFLLVEFNPFLRNLLWHPN
jgi:hypothetical protein